jgi:hypothetical protein
MKFFLVQEFSSSDMWNVCVIYTVLSGIDTLSFTSFVHDGIFQEKATPTEVSAVEFEATAMSETVPQYYEAPSSPPTYYQSTSLHS